MTPFLMHKRMCGTPRAGLYAISEMGPGGHLWPFTAIAAPVLAEVQNPRAAEKVNMRASLFGNMGLVPPGPDLDTTPLGALPETGLADLWGMSAGYETVVDVIIETMQKGIARRIPAIPEVSLPCPVLMMHMETVAVPYRPVELSALLEALDAHGEEVPTWETLQKQPWRDDPDLGTIKGDKNLMHWYNHLWLAVDKQDKPAQRKKLLDNIGIRMEQGIFGLSWITAFVQVLRPDQETVDPALAERGVLPALTPSDPRYDEYEQEEG